MVDFKNYKIWQRSHELVLDIFSVTTALLKSELFGLISQMNRAVISIPTNSAKGCGRETQKELIRFLYIAAGSIHELDYLTLVSKELGFIKEPMANTLIKEI